MSCKLNCNSLLKDLVKGFSILLSEKKYLSVTVFSDPLKNTKSRVRLTKTNYKSACNGYPTITVSIGKPNYREREFIHKCKKAKCSPRKYWINRIKK